MDTLGDSYILIPQDFGMIRNMLETAIFCYLLEKINPR